MSDLDFNHQVSSLHSSLRGFTKMFTADQDESLDLVQDTILKALSNKEKFRPDTNLKGWLFTIMRNTFINNYRKTRRTREAKHIRTEEIAKSVVEQNTFNNPSASFEYHDVWKHVHSLRDDLLIPFKLYTDGYKYHEIAEDQQIPIGTVKNRIFHARKEIQKKLAGVR